MVWDVAGIKGSSIKHGHQAKESNGLTNIILPLQCFCKLKWVYISITWISVIFMWPLADTLICKKQKSNQHKIFQLMNFRQGHFIDKVGEALQAYVPWIPHHLNNWRKIYFDTRKLILIELRAHIYCNEMIGMTISSLPPTGGPIG